LDPGLAPLRGRLYTSPGMLTRAHRLTSLIGLGISVGVARAEPPAALRPVQVIPLPGVQKRIDHLAIDLRGQRLFVAALGNGTLEVVDLAAGKRVRSVPGLQEPQGVVYLPDLKRASDAALHVLEAPALK